MTSNGEKVLVGMQEYSELRRTQASYNNLLEKLDGIGWPCRLSELPENYAALAQRCSDLERQLAEALRHLVSKVVWIGCSSCSAKVVFSVFTLNSDEPSWEAKEEKLEEYGWSLGSAGDPFCPECKHLCEEGN